MRCLEPKVSSGTVLKGTPKHLKPDDGMFTVTQFIAGPMKVLPEKGNKINFPNYEDIVSKFNLLLKNRMFVIILFHKIVVNMIQFLLYSVHKY